MKKILWESDQKLRYFDFLQNNYWQIFSFSIRLVRTYWEKVSLLFASLTAIWSKCIPNHLRWWHFAPYVSGFCHIHGKTPCGIFPV